MAKTTKADAAALAAHDATAQATIAAANGSSNGVEEDMEEDAELVLVEDELVSDDDETDVNPLNVRSPRTKTSMDVDRMTVTVGEFTFTALDLAREVRDRLLLDGLKGVLLRDGPEVYARLQDGSYLAKEPSTAKPTIRHAVAEALIEKGMDREKAIDTVEGLDRQALGRLKRDPDVARHFAVLRGEPNALEALVA